MNDSVQVIDSDEIAAVKADEIEGEVYEDGEVWAQRRDDIV